jgi:protein gp37
MSDNTSIPWAQASLNFATGCNKISPGCAHCYAMDRTIPRLQAMGQEKYKNGTKFTVHEKVMYEPLKWKNSRRIFVNSVSDTFHEEMPEEVLLKFFRDVVAKTPQHTYLLLTKRPVNMLNFFHYNQIVPSKYRNVWLGVTAENQEMANARLSILNSIPARIRFVSVEPMLGPVDLSKHANWLDWIIIGGESGPKQRVIPVKYVQDLVHQGKQMGIPVFLKQIHDGERLVKEPYIWIPGETEHKQYLEFPKG